MVERGGLENRCGGDSTQGSNPCPSARYHVQQFSLLSVMPNSFRSRIKFGKTLKQVQGDIVDYRSVHFFTLLGDNYCV